MSMKSITKKNKNKRSKKYKKIAKKIISTWKCFCVSLSVAEIDVSVLPINTRI